MAEISNTVQPLSDFGVRTVGFPKFIKGISPAIKSNTICIVPPNNPLICWLLLGLSFMMSAALWGRKAKPSASSPQLDSVVILHRAKPFWQLCVPKIEMATVFAGHIRDVHT